MADNKRTKGSGGTKKYGRDMRSPKHMYYNRSNKYFFNKLKRIIQSCGLRFAHTWAEAYDVLWIFKKVRNSMPKRIKQSEKIVRVFGVDVTIDA